MTIPHVQAKIVFDHVSCQFSCLLSKMYQQFKLSLLFAAAQSSNLSPTSKEKQKIQENNCAVVPRHSSVSSNSHIINHLMAIPRTVRFPWVLPATTPYHGLPSFTTSHAPAPVPTRRWGSGSVEWGPEFLLRLAVASTDGLVDDGCLVSIIHQPSVEPTA